MLLTERLVDENTYRGAATPFEIGFFLSVLSEMTVHAVSRYARPLHDSVHLPQPVRSSLFAHPLTASSSESSSMSAISVCMFLSNIALAIAIIVSGLSDC